ncbi:MAG: hypothetical protein PHV37_03715 [Candidatus Gastranaerophilales bacterium]|nr:hypothetical protein [Candidatus Gastranaerophilales bacterium]
MILKEFAEYLQNNIEDSSVYLLNKWIKDILETPPQSKVEQVIHAEIYIAKNKYNDTLLIGKSDSGRKLIDTLYNFALSFEQQKLARWLHTKKPDDFKNC